MTHHVSEPEPVEDHDYKWWFECTTCGFYGEFDSAMGAEAGSLQHLLETSQAEEGG